MQIFVREDHLEDGLKVAGGCSDEVPEEGDLASPTVQTQEEETRKDSQIDELRTKRLVYFAYILAALSFLVVSLPHRHSYSLETLEEEKEILPSCYSPWEQYSQEPDAGFMLFNR